MTWSWFIDHTALLALVVAAIAAGLSLANTLLNRRYRRQDAYLRMHDLLTTPEIAVGGSSRKVASVGPDSACSGEGD